MQNSYDSGSNSNSSSISSLSASSSDSGYKTTGPSELEADADSLTCRQSMVSSADQLDSDGPKLCKSGPKGCCKFTGAFIKSAAAKGGISQHMEQFLCWTLGSIPGLA